jgi:hypothetical protein
MSNKKFSISIHLLLGVALIAAISATGYYRSKYLEIKEQPPKIVTKIVESPDTAAKIVEIEKLKTQLAEQETKLKINKTETVVKAQTKPPPSPRRANFSLRDLKENDPERYQQIMEYYNKMNARMSKGVADKMVFFNDLDTSDMTDKELDNHRKLLEKLAKMHEATEKAGMNNNAEDIQSTMREQWKNYREISKLMTKERDYLIMDAGKKMGFNHEEAGLLKDYVKNAYEITSGGRSMFRGGGRRK